MELSDSLPANRAEVTGRWDTWVAQSVKPPTLDLGPGHDLWVHETEPSIGLCNDSSGPAWDSLSAPPLLMHTLSLKINNIKRKH